MSSSVSATKDQQCSSPPLFLSVLLAAASWGLRVQAGAVSAKADSDRAVALCGEKVQKVLIPASGGMLASVHEKAAGLRGIRLVDPLSITSSMSARSAPCGQALPQLGQVAIDVVWKCA